MSYNGWHNYQTWRVNLEAFDCFEAAEYSEDELRHFAEEFYLDGVENNYAAGLIISFLSQVDWWEIADSLKEETSNAN